MMPVSLLQKVKQTTNTARAYLDPRQVGYLIFYVTNRCNFRCNFCFYSAEIETITLPCPRNA
jgi:2-iminoacetate synthase ThiH